MKQDWQVSDGMDRDWLVIFVKAPRPGFVKTRLAARLGQAGAVAAYRTLVETLLDRLSDLSEVTLLFTPADAAPEIRRWLKPGWKLATQSDGDLGARVELAFAQAFAAGARRVAIIGSDCPRVEAADVRAAWDRLAHHEVVLGPATDGGYWLVALREPQPALFEGIHWGTATVLEETLVRARRAGLECTLLRQLRDVDVAEDWEQFLAEQTRPAT